jgi:hypothetical protein
MYNIQQNGKTAVKMEIWVDAKDNGKWTKVNEFVDSGGWGNAGGKCGGVPDEIITLEARLSHTDGIIRRM